MSTTPTPNLPSHEIFYVNAATAALNAEENAKYGVDESDPDAAPTEPGWYYWYCQPGCMPDSMAFGPYESEREALAALVDENDVEPDLWLCTDCLFAAVNDDYTGIEDDALNSAIQVGLTELAKHGNPVYTGQEVAFSTMTCDCCGRRMGGSWYGFNLI